MRTIWKYELGINDEYQGLYIPSTAMIVHVDMASRDDDMGVGLWVELETGHVITRPRVFKVVGTGHDNPDGTYVGTAVGNLFEWHVYEVFGQVAEWYCSRLLSGSAW